MHTVEKQVPIRSDVIDQVYENYKSHLSDTARKLVPYLRRFLRFLALPYAYFKLVNWQECPVSHYHVFKDFLYIFFVLKDFPDYYSKCRLWEVDKQEWKYYYGSIYNPHQRARLRKKVQRKEYEILFSDKLVCHQLCQSGGLPVPELYAFIEPEDNYKSILTKLVKQHQKVVIKPTHGKGGKAIFLACIEKGRVTLFDNNKFIDLEDFEILYPSIVQQYISQHESLAKFSYSLNTIRTETLLTLKKDIIILGTFLRFGCNNSFTDNQYTGGLSVGIDICKGRLKEYALDKMGKKYYVHPDSGFTFKNFEIPFWNEVINLSKNIQSAFPYYKMLGPDIAITAKGPIIIEINASPDHAGLEMDYGPTLRDEKVRQEFKRYDLLINKPILGEM